MRKLILQPNLNNHDDIYEALVGLHEGLTAEESLGASSRLLLVLANHIGDADIIREAIEIARQAARV